MTAGWPCAVEIPYPFVRTRKFVPDECGGGEVECWHPGVNVELVAPDGGDSECVAEGIGRMLIQQISRHKPAKYPERVFYVRQWRDPDGKVFGKRNLRVATASQFERLCKGFRYQYRTIGENMK